MTQKYLRQISSNCVYHYSDELAADSDFELYEPKAKAVATPPVEEPVVVPPEPIPEESPDEDIKQIARAVLKKRKTK